MGLLHGESFVHCKGKHNLISQSRRNIQSQLSTLLPNVKKNRRIYRPSGIAQGKARLAAWKKCREYIASRHARRKLKSRRELQGLPDKILTTRNSTDDDLIPSSALLKTSSYYDPFAHWNYEAELPFGIPSHVSMPEIGSWYSNTHTKPSLPAVGQAPSAAGENRDSEKGVYVSLAQINGIEGLPPDLGKSPLDISRQVSQTRVSDDRSSSPPTRRVSVASFRTMSTRISSGISSSLRHANSVLSKTNSARSSLLSAMSLSSRSSSISRNVSISAQEQWIRDMIVDEVSTQPTIIGTRSVNTCVRSLHQRPCCKFDVLGILGDVRCELCGFAAIHELFRNQCGSEDVLGDITTRDAFGNTPVHHAAAAGNMKRIENVLKAITASEVHLLALRNTSGETFLHVAREPVDLFNPFYPARREIYNQFKVGMRDFHGRPVTDKILRADIRWRQRFDGVEELSLSLIEAIKALDLDYSDPFLLAEKLIDEDRRDVILHVRDKEGLTALAIAAARGYPDIVLSLLHYGANPNARTLEGPKGCSILSYVAEQMQGEKDDARLSRMLCCVNILADSGAKFEPTEFEEYCMKHMETAVNPSKEKVIESFESSPASEETRSSGETDIMITKRQSSPQISKSRRWNPKPQVASKAKKAKKALARLLVPATTSASPPIWPYDQPLNYGRRIFGFPDPWALQEAPASTGTMEQCQPPAEIDAGMWREPLVPASTIETTMPRESSICPILETVETSFEPQSLFTLPEEPEVLQELPLTIPGDNFSSYVKFCDLRMDSRLSCSTWHGSEPSQLFGQEDILAGAMTSLWHWNCHSLATVGTNLPSHHTCSDSSVSNTSNEDSFFSKDDQDTSSLPCFQCDFDGQLGPTIQFPQPQSLRHH
jgi:hypothetical protein